MPRKKITTLANTEDSVDVLEAPPELVSSTEISNADVKTEDEKLDEALKSKMESMGLEASDTEIASVKRRIQLTSLLASVVKSKKKLFVIQEKLMGFMEKNSIENLSDPRLISLAKKLSVTPYDQIINPAYLPSIIKSKALAKRKKNKASKAARRNNR